MNSTKNYLYKIYTFFGLIFLMSAFNPLSAQMTITSGFDATTIETELEILECVDVSAISFTGVNSTVQVAVFSDGISGAGLEIDRGILLTTGNASEAATDNSSGSISAGITNSGLFADADLDGLDVDFIGTHDEAIITF